MRHTTSLLGKERCGILCGTCEQDFFDSKQAANLSFFCEQAKFFLQLHHTSWPDVTELFTVVIDYCS
jgi:hypothetical protein